MNAPIAATINHLERPHMFDDTRYDPETGNYQGSLDLRGYTGTLPASLTSVGGSLDLEGYSGTLPDWIIYAGEDSRGYSFCGVLTDAVWRVRAGCQDFTVSDALGHWGPGGESDRPDCLALVEKIAAEIERREGQMSIPMFDDQNA